MSTKRIAVVQTLRGDVVAHSLSVAFPGDFLDALVQQLNPALTSRLHLQVIGLGFLDVHGPTFPFGPLLDRTGLPEANCQTP